MKEDSVRINTNPKAEESQLRIGEVAAKTGLTVRTLHHYEAVGLLAPADRTPAGHRLFGPGQVRELQRILALRSLGLSLDDIRACLRDRRFSLEATLRLQLDGVKEQIRLLQDLRSRLTGVLKSVVEGREVSVEEFLSTMEMMTMIEKHYTPQQLEELRARREAIGPDAVREAEEEWPVLIGQVREAMKSGADPNGPDVKALAKRWKSLVDGFTGGNPEIAESLVRMYQAEPDVATQQGLDPGLFQFIGRAMASLPEVD